MKSIYNLEEQNSNFDSKIIAGIERISQVFKILLWEKAKVYKLSPFQIQVLIFIYYHKQNMATVSYLAQEFNVSKPTISDTIKTLEQKKYISKNIVSNDTRSYIIKMTSFGEKIVLETENFANPMTAIIASSDEDDKLVLWKTISNLIIQLNKSNLISVQRTCFNCKNYELFNKQNYCNLLNQHLKTEEIRIDCNDFEPALN